MVPLYLNKIIYEAVNMLPETIKPKIIVVCGPTAMGKTSTAIALAEGFSGEIIGADSMQIYRWMDIGTAKPTPDEKARIPHHMIDIRDPDEHFDAQDYLRLAREVLVDLFERSVTPFVVGGTGFYIKALVHGLFEVEPADADVRNRLHRQINIHGSAFLHRRLSRVDPEAAEHLHPNDTYRIIRALEIFEITGKKMSAYHRAHRFQDNPFNVLKIGLHMDREQLYMRINHRVDAMIAAGFLEEVQKLLAKGYSPDLKSMQAIGYRHMVDFIQGRHSWEETLRTLKRDTRRYAKRQLTWFKADPDMIWYHPEQIEDIHRTIQDFIDESRLNPYN